MKSLFKNTLIFISLLFFSNIVASQELTIESVNENSSKKFEIPVLISNISFNEFEIELSTLDSIAKFRDINLKNYEDSFTVEVNNYSSSIKFKSKETINISTETLFNIEIKTDESFVKKDIIQVQKVDFYNNKEKVNINVISKESTAIVKAPLFTKDTIVFGLLMLALGIVFFSESKEQGFWSKFYKIVPGLFVAYMIPAFLTTSGLIAPEWETISEDNKIISHSTNLYYMASRYLLPAALVLMTLSIDLKGVFNLGWKALVMFFAGTVGIVIGGPIALLLIAQISPDLIGVTGPDAVWRGLSTLAGSWIGGGANQTAMLEIYGYNQKLYGGMVFVDIVVANIWMALILIGIGKRNRFNKWLKADTKAIEDLKDKVSKFSESVKRNPSLTDIMIIAAIAFGAVSFAHLASDYLGPYFDTVVSNIENPTTRNIFTFLGSKFFWMISIATLIAIGLSFTKARNYEGAGASKFGSVFIYILVATIGMKMDLTLIFDNGLLILVGLVWMTIHALLLIGVAKLIKAPYFFLAVGSQANVGGAASAPIVASAFHPSLATVGVLLAVFGYAVGTIAAIGCTILMQIVSGA
ncbi:putative membrane protein [Winogradskyella wandonensis]|uniref:Putative membrane protein n=2 Tax=Winogradskyella wandonensis TaxID=1442586 RepID=A0A4R1KQP5_9FLAO|nr:putative membrane protein [Winogradskyella wandonensis]